MRGFGRVFVGFTSFLLSWRVNVVAVVTIGSMNVFAVMIVVMIVVMVVVMIVVVIVVAVGSVYVWLRGFASDGQVQQQS